MPENPTLTTTTEELPASATPSSATPASTGPPAAGTSAPSPGAVVPTETGVPVPGGPPIRFEWHTGDWFDVFEKHVALVQSDIARAQAEDRIVVYLSCPIRPRARSSSSAASSTRSTSSVPTTCTASSAPTRAAAVRWWPRWSRTSRAAVDPDFWTDFGTLPGPDGAHRPLDLTGRDDAAVREARRKKFVRFYTVRAGGSYSLGCHDEWNILVRLNRARAGHPAYGPGELIAAYYGGRARSMAESELETSPGYEI